MFGFVLCIYSIVFAITVGMYNIDIVFVISEVINIQLVEVNIHSICIPRELVATRRFHN